MRRAVVVRAAVSVGLLAAMLWLLPWAELRGAWGRITATVWLTALGGFLLGHAAGVLKWRALLAAGRAPLALRDAAAYYGAALFANLCLPGVVGGDVLRMGLAGRRTGRPEAALLGGVADRLLDLIATGLVVAGGLVAARGTFAPRAVLLVESLLVAGVVGLVVLGLLLRRPLARWPRRLRRPVGRALVALRYLVRHPGTAGVAFLISLGMQGGFVLVNVAIGRAVGIDVPVAVWFVAWPLAKLVGLVPISLGGLAVRDATLAALLAPAGVPIALGVVAGLVWQSVMIGGGLVGAGVWWLHTLASDDRFALALRAPTPRGGTVSR